MSWIQKLYETYENCQPMIGAGTNDNEIPLLPICHTTQKAQIEIVVDQYGNFKRAGVVPKNNARTIIPCTEASGGRAGSKPETHPLCDKLQYIANDFSDFGGRVTSGYSKNPKEPHENYKNLLKYWCESEYSHQKAKTILKYVEKGNVIKDLIDYQILFIGDDGKLLESWENNSTEGTPEIFKVSQNTSQTDAFVRWNVEIPGDPQSAVWTDASLFDSWIKYYASTKQNLSLCYVTGNEKPYAEQHPAKIRNDGDKAKLISSNDSSGFTYRGRFLTADQACGVGFEVTQKAHNALRWLISRQGYRRGDQAIVAWATSGKDIPNPMEGSYSLFWGEELENDSTSSVYTAQEAALKLNKMIAGYSVSLENTDNIVVMGLDSATPGRMAISFYRELTGSDFLHRLEDWHKSCSWIHNYMQKEITDAVSGKKKKVSIKFVGVPSPDDMAEAAYGNRIDDKLRKNTVERILPCIIDGWKIPRDLVRSTVQRASNRIGMEPWEWKKTLSIACALFRKEQIDYEKEVLDLALEENRKTRDYLYGRLLALADSLENWALNAAGENRQTNAARLMQRFAEHPYSTWRIVELALRPYKARLGAQSSNRQRLISQVMDMFEHDDFICDKKLSGEFLLGYHCQLEALWKKEEAKDDNLPD